MTSNTLEQICSLYADAVLLFMCNPSKSIPAVFLWIISFKVADNGFKYLSCLLELNFIFYLSWPKWNQFI